MRLKFYSENSEQVVFEIFSDEASNNHRELIVVNLKHDDPAEAYRKRMIADYLGEMANGNYELDWQCIDINIAEIKKTKIYVL